MRSIIIALLLMVLLANIVMAQNETNTTITYWYQDLEQFIIVVLVIGFILWSVKKESILLGFVALFMAVIGYGLGFISDQILFILAIASLPSIVYAIVRRKI